jgi:hypothetical protein
MPEGRGSGIGKRRQDRVAAGGMGEERAAQILGTG